jgi:hypothetical protein
MNDTPALASSRASIFWLIGGLIAAIFLSGVAAGFLEAMAKDGATPVSPRFGAALVGLTVAAISIALYWPHMPGWKSLSPRRRLYWGSLASSALVGVIIGALIQIDSKNSGRDAVDLLSNTPLSPDFAIAAAAIWAIGISLACLAYHRAIDDHEERAWLWAGLAGWYAFIIPAPIWWVLHRASVAPPVDAMLLFLASMGVNAIVWTWLKFR